MISDVFLPTAKSQQPTANYPWIDLRRWRFTV